MFFMRKTPFARVKAKTPNPCRDVKVPWSYEEAGNPLAPADASFINLIYYKMPIGRLLSMDKNSLQASLARAKLVCRWLEGILELSHKLERKGK